MPDLKFQIVDGQPVLDEMLLQNGLPVIVWIHGGEFTSGSSLEHEPLNDHWSPDPRQLASTGKVIVVSIQYRLGSFGYLFFDDQEAPGNVGLLDVKKSLQWIKKNILAFGGNPDQITVMGQDAGGNLALILKAIEKEGEDPLFHRLILQSGSIQHPWSFVEPRIAFRRSLSLAAMVGCPMSGSSKSVRFYS